VFARDPVFLSAHSGINFWIGNNPYANGYPRFPPGLRAGQAAMLEDSINAAESASGHSLKRGEVSTYWSAKAKGYIANHFGEWLKLLATKVRNLWSAFQYDDLSIITIMRQHGVIFPGIYFGLVAALGLPGMILGWHLAPVSRWISFAILLHFAALLPVFVTERYRLPVVPGLLSLAAIGLSILWQADAAGKYQTVAVYIALLLISTTLVSWPQRNSSLWALDAYNSGWQALESENYPLAEKNLSLAHAYVPDNAETNFALGNLRLAQGNREGAIAFYREALKIDPSHKGALNNLGVIALEARDIGRARMYFESALAQDRRNAKTHFLLAKTALAAKDMKTAELEIDQAIAVSPAQPEFVVFKKELMQRNQPQQP
jgi:tetratricopeptide (TPR) repeat protein